MLSVVKEKYPSLKMRLGELLRILHDNNGFNFEMQKELNKGETTYESH